MSVLTRIKNNQITDSTILANTKIVPGSIVGSLFNSNLTMTSDVTITGNLTVQGSSTQLTLASTNTFVNDPLIVLNNAFTGTNTNDIGLLFNRGNETNQALIWNESNDEFRLIATTETGETYGTVSTSSFANLHIGNLTVEFSAAVGSITTSGDINAANLTLSGDAAVNGGNLTTTATTFNLLTANAATVNAFTSATTLELGAATGTTNINNNLDVDGNVSIDGENLVVTSTTFNLANTTATTLNFAGAATTLTIGATTGTLTVRNALLDVVGNATVGGTLDVTGLATLTDDLAVNGGDVTTTATTFNLLDTTATTVNAFGDATAIDLGATTGTLTINNPTVVGTSTTQDVFNTTATTVNFAGAATTLTIAATTGNTAIRNNLDVGLTLQAQDINNTVIGNVTPAAATFTSATVQGNTSLGLTTAAAINNTPIGNITPSTGSFTTLLSSGVTQVTNTSIATGIGTGAFRVDGGASVSGNLWVGGNINIVGNTFTISGNAGQFFGDNNGFGALYAGVTGFTSLPRTVFQSAADVNDYAQNNFENVNTGAQASTDWVATAGAGDDFSHYINMGITSGNWDGTQENSLKDAVKPHDGYLYVQGNVEIPGSGGNLVIGASLADHYVKVVAGGNTAAYTVAVFDAPGTPSTNTTTGALTVIGGVGVFGNIHANNLSTGGEISADDLTLAGNLAVNGGDITTTATTVNLLDTTATTVNAFGDATTIDIGAATGTLTINNPTVVGTSTTQDLYNTVATTVNFAGAASTLVLGDTTGTANIRNATTNIIGNATVGGTLAVTGVTTFTDDIAVNGGDITTTATTATVFNTNATTVDAFGAATDLEFGATTGTLTLNNPTVVGTSTTQDVFNTTAATVNAFGDATALNLGAATGTATINNDTVNLEGNVNVNKTTPSTNTTTGALVVDGGVGIAGNLNVGEDVIITGNLTVQGEVVTLNTATLDVEDLNITVAKGAADSAAADGAGLTVDGANATLIYNHATTSWDLNKITRILDDADTTSETTGAFRVAGGVAIAKDLFVGGGDIITDETTFNLLNTTATTLNVGGAASTLTLGATTGNLVINNPTVVGTQATQNLYNTTATTLNFAGAATALTIGATTGTTTIRNALVAVDGNATVGGTLGVTGDTTLTGDLGVNGGDITTTATTFNLLDTTATTVNAFGAATDLEFGATTGTLTINNPTVVGTQTAQDLYNTIATTVNFAGAASTLVLGDTTGTANIRNATTNIFGNATIGGTLSVTGEVIFTDDIAVNGGDITTTATTATVFNANATTVNAFGAASNLEFGATTGTLTLNNPTVVGTSTTQDLYNTTATTLNFAGEAANLNIGAETGTVSLYNANIWLPNAVTIDGAQATINLLGNATTVDAFKSATDLELGATTGTLTLNNPTVVGTSTTQDLYNTTATTVNFAGSATSLVTGATTGTFSLRNANLHLPNATTIHSSQSNVSLLNENVTTVNGFGSATTLTLAATTGTTTVRNNLTVDLSITARDIQSTVIGNVDPASATFTTLTSQSTTILGAVTAESINNTVIGNVIPAAGDFTRLAATGIVYANSTATSTSYLNGGIIAAGGAGIAGNLSIQLGQQLTIGIEDPQANVGFPERQIVAIGNINSSAGMNLRNVNSGNAATTNYIAIADNNVGENHIAVFGIAGSGFSSLDTDIKANDAYLFVTSEGPDGGNLHIDASNNNSSIYFSVGGSVANNQVLQISNSNVQILKDTISTSSTSGALVVTGGVGLGANLNVHAGAVINRDQTAEAFQVKGQFATTLIYADSITDTVTIGGSNTTPIAGATLRVNGTGAMVLPVGTTSQRPSTAGNVDVAGMIRLNSSLNILEYYDGDAWQSSQGSFTVISSESFTGDGDTAEFTLAGSGTTAGTIVAINGIVQIPITSYSVTESTLTFTEAPEIGDLIDVRLLSTTTTVDELGFNQNIFKANIDYAYISTGTASSIERFLIDTNGLVTVTGNMEIYGNLTVNGGTAGQINVGDSDSDNVAITAEINSNLVPNENNLYDLGKPTQRWKTVYSHETVHDQTPVSVTANATPILIDSFLTSEYSSAKYLVQIKDGSAIQAAELLLVQDTTDAFITTYGILSNNGELGTFTANVSSGNVNLFYTSTSATNSGVKLHPTYIV